MKPVISSSESASGLSPKLLVSAAILLFLGAAGLRARAEEDRLLPDDHGLTVNYDINTVTTPYLRQFEDRDTVGKEELWPIVDIYVGTQVKSLLFNVFCQFSATDSQVFTTYADKYLQKEENGVEVDHSAHFGGLYNIQRRLGMDVFGIWIERCREKGISPGISVRMNDAHLPQERTSFLRSDFFYEAKERGWMLGRSFPLSYFQRCLDYSVPQVREKMLAYIAELLRTYDIDTLELDFMREIYCFSFAPGQSPTQRRGIMNGFIRSVSELVEEAEDRLGHPIELSVRLMRDISQCGFLGFDVETWQKEGLVDAVVVSPRWFTCDSDIPVASWVEAFPKLRIQAGLEVMVLGKETTVPMVAAQAVQYLSQGSKGIYLFNYHENPDSPLERNQHIFRSCGSLETALKERRRHVVTRQDVSVPGDKRTYDPLSKPLSSPLSLSVATGPIPFGSKVTLFFGVEADGSKDPCVPELSVNGRRIKASRVSESPVSADYVKAPSRFYRVDISRLRLQQDRQDLLFAPTSYPTTITAVELLVEPPIPDKEVSRP